MQLDNLIGYSVAAMGHQGRMPDSGRDGNEEWETIRMGFQKETRVINVMSKFLFRTQSVVGFILELSMCGSKATHSGCSGKIK